MLKNTFGLSLVLGVLGCAAPQRASTPASADHDPAMNEVAQLKDALARLDNRLGHLESEVSAASAENELTAMTIDSVSWSDGDAPVFSILGGQRTLLCHVVEWRGYGKMLRFIRKADPAFALEADGHPAVEARMVTGGICNSDGSTRFGMLTVSGKLDPSTRYRLRPINENEQYRWSVPADLVVLAPEARR